MRRPYIMILLRRLLELHVGVIRVIGEKFLAWTWSTPSDAASDRQRSEPLCPSERFV